MSTAADLYMKLTTVSGEPVEGEVRVPKYRDQIELIDWKWKVSHNAKFKRREPSVLQFSKIMDRATPTMLLHMKSGRLLKARIVLADTSVDNDFSLVIDLQKVRITEYSFNIKAAEEQKESQVEEDWTFDYETITFDYRPEETKGTAQVELVRPANASTDSPGGVHEKVLKMARGLSVKQLDELWEALKRDADAARLQGTKPPGKEKK